MKMKVIIFGILCVSAIQVSASWEPRSDEDETSTSSSESIPKKKVRTCEDRWDGYRSKIKVVKKLYGDYYAEYEKLKVKGANSEDLLIIESEHGQFERNITAFSNRYARDLEKISNLPKGHERQMFCLEEIHWFYALTINLTKIATQVKSDIPIMLNQIGAPKKVVDNFDKLLSRTVNCLFLIHLGSNLFQDAMPFLKRVFKITDDKVELENEWKFESDKIVPTKVVVVPDYQEDFNGNNDKMDNEIQKNFKELEDNTKIEEAEKLAKEGLEGGLEEEGNEIEGEEAEIFEEPLVIL